MKLHEHLNKEHYKCHICDKQGKPNQFFKDYTRLERHFDRDHYLCHDGQCLSARFVVFENEIDLRAHEKLLELLDLLELLEILETSGISGIGALGIFAR